MILRIGLFLGLILGLVLGVAVGVEGGLAEGLYASVGGLIIGLIVGVGLGVPLGLVDVWRAPLAATSAVTPRVVYRRDVRSHRVGGLMGGLIGCLCAGITILPLAWSGAAGLVELLAFGLAFGVSLGLLSGLVSGFRVGAAPSLLFTEIALLLRGRRVRFMTMLETALARQVLRQAGAVYQFRHADLQDRLADRYEAGLIQRRAT
jgi:hypothetical protein